MTALDPAGGPTLTDQWEIRVVWRYYVRKAAGTKQAKWLNLNVSKCEIRGEARKNCLPEFAVRSYARNGES